jgi:hypothetical protein
MPIVDIKIDDELGFNELGRIRLGVRTTNKDGVEYSKETPYFVLKDAQGLIPDYGTEPKELLAYLPFKDRNRNFDTHYERYRGSGKGNGSMYCQGNGEVIEWAVDPGRTGEIVVRNKKCILPYQEENGERYEVGDIVPCSGREGEEYYPRCAECQAKARLYLLVRDPKNPRILANGNKLGYYMIGTGSIRNIINITQGMNTVARLAESMGREDDLSFIPIVIKRVPGNATITMKDKETGNGYRGRVKKHYIEMDLDNSWLNLAMQSVNPELLTANDTPPALESGEPDYVDAPAYEYAPLVSDQIADVEAMRDTPLLDFGEITSFLQNTLGSAYDERVFFLDVRARMGVGRTASIKPSQAWPHIIDEVVSILSGTEV